MDGLDLWDLVPPLRRARGFRLYLGDGRRLVDLWQQGGRASLGHGYSGVTLAMKSATARGLCAPFPSRESAALERALRRLARHLGWANAVPRWYADSARAAGVLASCGYPAAAAALSRDPALEDASPAAAVSVWRPRLSEPSLPQAAKVLVPVLPGSWAPAPAVILFQGDAPVQPPASDPCPPSALAVLARSCDGLVASLAAGTPYDPSFLDGVLPSTWRRRGFYVAFPTGEPFELRRERFLRFLDAGFLLPPGPELPLVLPLELSSGERALLRTLLAGVAEGSAVGSSSGRSEG